MSAPSRNSKRNHTTTTNQGPPGPASYEPKMEVSHANAPRWTMSGTNSREIPIIKNLPGPGQYDVRLPESQRKTLIYGKAYQIDKEAQQKPGPGAYKVEVSQLSRTGFKIGSEKRYKDEKKLSPGPGDYHIIMKNHVTSYIIGQQTRSGKICSNHVGPGQYEIPSLLKTDAGFKMVPRREKTFSMITPGPDAYGQLRQERVKSFKIGTSKREGIYQKSSSPGPANYEVQAIKESVGYTIGKGQRQDTKLEVLPGPGTYKPNKPSNAPKYSIYQRYREKTENSGPGPQSYTIGEFRETKSIIFGQAKRDSQNKIQIPGPGEYDTEVKVKKPQVSIVFGREKRSQSCSENTYMPGPGAYDITSTFLLKKK
ncbi:unnamed protein product [Paramecium octaurelia]|uniref:Sperm-tail PG-rich repeat-containing protein 2 n=1 Tax=Paramecium octaurelia TaxID=43137 RepID=A0A8S1WCX7_PAROT|nr:unnamed protein product [Paramecium octaurelia]